MKYLCLSLLFMGNALATEVATIESYKPLNEIQLIVTDESFLSAVEKNFTAKNCRPRNAISNQGAVRENYFPKSCKASVIQFLLNNGYKADLAHKIFTK